MILVEPISVHLKAMHYKHESEFQQVVEFLGNAPNYTINKKTGKIVFNPDTQIEHELNLGDWVVIGITGWGMAYSDEAFWNNYREVTKV